MARGFTIPPLSWSAGGALFLDPNPSLDREKVVSYQAGIETAALRYLWLKGTVFRHELDDALVKNFQGGGPPAYNDIYLNNGDITRKGLELEAKTVPFYNLSFKGGFAYVDLNPANESGSDEIYTYNIGIKYDDSKAFNIELLGHYIWWNLNALYQANYDDFIWDLNLNRKIWAKAKTSAVIFFTAHNLFNGSQYTYVDSNNPGRRIEAGVRFKF